MSKRLVMAQSPGTGLFMTNTSGKLSPKVDTDVQRSSMTGSKIMMEELQTTKQLLTLAERRCSRYEVEKQEYLRDIECLKTRASAAETKYNQVKKAREASNYQYEALCSDNAGLKAALESERSERSMMERRYKQAKAELDQLRNESDEFRVKEREWKAEIVKLVNENAELQDRTGRLEEAVKQLESERNTLVREGQKLIAEYERESENRLQLEEEVSSWRTTVQQEVAKAARNTRGSGNCSSSRNNRKHQPQVNNPETNTELRLCQFCGGQLNHHNEDDIEAVRGLP